MKVRSTWQRPAAMLLLSQAGAALMLACPSYRLADDDAGLPGATAAEAGALDAGATDGPADTPATPHATPDAAADAPPKATLDAPPEAALDAPPEAALDAPADVPPAAPDAAADAAVPTIVTGAAELISVSSLGVQGNADSTTPSVSNNYRYVVFRSDATNLVPSDSNGASDVFLRDRALLKTIALSVTSSGATANGQSSSGYITPSGNFVVFASVASNLVAGDLNGKSDIFLYHIAQASLQRVSVASGGGEANDDATRGTASDDGRFIAFDSVATNLVSGDTNGVRDVFLRDRLKDTTIRISVGAGNVQGNALSQRPHVSADGRFVAFESDATNLVAGDSNAVRDIFGYEVATGVVSRLSAGRLAGGVVTEGNDFSDFVTMTENSQYVLFRSAASNFAPGDSPNTVDLFRVNVSGLNAFARIHSGLPQALPAARAALSADGLYVAFESPNTFGLNAADTNGANDVWLADLSVLPPANPSYRSIASGGATGNGASGAPWLTADGMYCAYETRATNIAGITDINGSVSDIVLTRVR